VKILDPGLFTTVQDLGRIGYQKDGVTSSGAMDPVALRVANRLVCNDDDEAGLEMTLKGPTIEFQRDALIAIAGADLSPRIADLDVPTWRALLVDRGSVLELGSARWGCRAYLAVAGGIAVPEVMGSRSTYVRARIGGVEGRSLRAGDEVPAGRPSARAVREMVEVAASHGPVPFALTERAVARDDAAVLYRSHRSIRALRGPHFDLFDETSRKTLFEEAFEVSPRADRMGYRLTGPRLSSSERSELISSAVLTGSVQVPPGGEAIVLMVDRQTTGGYPMIAQVAAVDLPLVAQLKPGDEVRFEEATIEQAQSALREQDERLRSIEEGVTADAHG
jgi:antagonist of KipI